MTKANVVYESGSEGLSPSDHPVFRLDGQRSRASDVRIRGVQECFVGPGIAKKQPRFVAQVLLDAADGLVEIVIGRSVARKIVVNAGNGRQSHVLQRILRSGRQAAGGNDVSSECSTEGIAQL